MFNVIINPRSQAELYSMALLSPFERLALFELLHLALNERQSKLSALLKIQEYTDIAIKHIQGEDHHSYCNELHYVILRDLANIVTEIQKLWIEHGLEWDGRNPSLPYIAQSIVNYIVDDVLSGDSELLSISGAIESQQQLI